MSVESKSDLSASELKAKRKEEKRKLKEAKKEKKASQNLDEVVKEQSEKKSTKKSKKRSRDNEEDEDKQRRKDRHEKADSAKEDAEAETRSRKKRKSVSFADDVNVQTTEHKNETNDIGKETKSSDEGDLQDAENEEQSRERRKREKKEKREQRRKESEKNSPASTEGDKPDSTDNKSIIAYLSQYYHDRASWKFQKIREAQLLKQVFSLEHVPAEYNPALLAYLKGLKSEGARTRLRKSAQEVIKFDEKHHDTTSLAADESAMGAEKTKDIAKLPPLSESWREEYGNAVYRFKGNLNAGIKDLNEGVTLTAPDGEETEDGDVQTNVLTRLEHRKRAEMVLWTVSGKIGKHSSAKPKQDKSTEADGESEPVEPAIVSKKNGNKPKAPARKKRKNRTMVVEISSSSESSDSDSD